MLRKRVLLQLIAIYLSPFTNALVPEANVKSLSNDATFVSADTNVQQVWQTDIKAQGYRLEIADTITIHASSNAGFFYAEQTLAQLKLLHGDQIPAQIIEDAPLYQWRGSMIDVARNFRSIDYLKKHIQRMAFFKLNVLHLHLTDDQGWRIEIKNWPKLTEIGGATSVGNHTSGYYTQAQMAELIAFAADHHVMIVPEIDMPGHIQSALASYPELACPGKSTETYTGMKVGFSHLCLENPEVIYPFVEDVITQLSELFPSPYFHMGGDETPLPKYNDFVERLERLLAAQGKTMIGWEEIVKANIDGNTVVHYWQQHTKLLNIAIEKGNPIVFSPCRNAYLDHGNYAGQKRTLTWCNKNGLPIKQVHKLNVPKGINVIGIEAPLWGEMLRTDKDADNRLWPRLAVIADLAWHGPSRWRDISSRLSALKPWFDAQQIHYYREPELGWES